MRDDFARAFFQRAIRKLAHFRETEQLDHFERFLDSITNSLPEGFDGYRAEEVLRAIVSRFISERDCEKEKRIFS